MYAAHNAVQSTAQSTPAPRTSSAYHARGVVLNSATGAPVPRALVTSFDQNLATLTDSEGRFSLNINFAGDAGGQTSTQLRITLKVIKPGFLPDGSFLEVNADSDAASTVRITPESVIAGHITATGVDEASGVTVQLFQRTVQDGLAQWTSRDSKRTDSHGNYRFANLGAGEYRLMTREWSIEPLTATPPREITSEFPPALYPNAVSADRSGAAHLLAGATLRADLSIRAVPYFAIHVPISNLQPGNGAAVEVEDGRTGSGFTLGFNSRTGEIEGSLPDGSYTVTASSFSRDAAGTGTTELTVKGAPIHSAPLSLLPNGNIPVLIHKQFTAEGSLSSGRSQGGGSQSFSGPLGSTGGEGRSIDISLRPEKAGGHNGNGMQNRSGRGDEGLAMENVPPGRYHAVIWPHQGYVASATAGGIDLSATPLVVGPGGTSAPIDVVLRDDTATLEGTVKLPAAAGAGGLAEPASLYLFPLTGFAQPFSSVTSSVNNSFSFSNLSPGRYLLLAFRNRPNIQSIEYRNEEAMHLYDGKSAIVTLSPGQTSKVEVTAIDGSE